MSVKSNITHLSLARTNNFLNLHDRQDLPFIHDLHDLQDFSGLTWKCMTCTSAQPANIHH